eukprot:186352_1
MYFAILVVWCLLCSYSTATTCAASSGDVNGTNPSFFGENNGHKWKIESIALSSDLVIDIEIINSDKISADITLPPPIVFIHGWMDSRLSWMTMVPYFLSLFNNDQILILPTLRGHGDSQIFPLQNSTFSLSEYVNDIISLLTKLGFSSNGNQQFHFIGHSMGSFITMNTVINYPQIISSAVFMNGVPQIHSKPRFNWDSNKNEPTFEQKLALTRKGHQSQVDKGWISQGFADILMRENLKVNSIAMRESYIGFYKMNLTQPLIDTYNDNDIESMVIFGQQDFFPPKQQTEYAQNIGTLKENIISLPDCGHDTLYRYPQIIANKI